MITAYSETEQQYTYQTDRDEQYNCFFPPINKAKLHYYILFNLN